MEGVLYVISFAAAGYYMIRALHNVYRIGWGRAILYTWILGLFYSVVLAVMMLLYILLVLMFF